MSKFARGRSWIDQRISDDMTLGDGRYRVDLVARRGTGVQGFRVSLVFISNEGRPDVEVMLPNASTIADVHRLARDLQSDPERVRSHFSAAAA